MEPYRLFEFTWSFTDCCNKISNVRAVATNITEARNEILKIFSIIVENIENYNSIDFWEKFGINDRHGNYGRNVTDYPNLTIKDNMFIEEYIMTTNPIIKPFFKFTFESIDR